MMYAVTVMSNENQDNTNQCNLFNQCNSSSTHHNHDKRLLHHASVKSSSLLSSSLIKSVRHNELLFFRSSNRDKFKIKKGIIFANNINNPALEHLSNGII